MIKKYISKLCLVSMFFACLSMSVLNCTQSLYGLDDTLTALATVQVGVKREEVEQLPPDVQDRLRVGVIWLGFNIPSIWCAEQLSALLTNDQEAVEVQAKDENDDKDEDVESESTEDEAEHLEFDFTKITQLLTLCRNPLGVAPALAGPSVPLQSNQDNNSLLHQLTFTALPPSDVLIGTPDARVAYGALVVFDDLNENGILDLGLSIPPVFWDDRRGFDNDDDDKDEENDERAMRRFGEWMVPDELYSASFTSLLDTHQRLVFREGNFVDSFFYPMGNCVPPKGFSMVNVEGEFPSARCESYSISTPTVLTISRPDLDRQEVICLPTDVFTFEPPEEEPDPSFEYQCMSATDLAARDPEQSCKNLSVITLIDCPPSEPNCKDPEWDIRDTPPEWWPCTEE